MKHAVLLLMLFTIGDARAYLDSRILHPRERKTPVNVLQEYGYEATTLSRRSSSILERRGICSSKKSSTTKSENSPNHGSDDPVEKARRNRIMIEQRTRLESIPAYPLHTVSEEPSQSSPNKRQKSAPRNKDGGSLGPPTPAQDNKPRLERKLTPPPKNRNPPPTGVHGHSSRGSPSNVPASSYADPSSSYANLPTEADPRRKSLSNGKPPVSIYSRRFTGEPNGSNGVGRKNSPRVSGSSPKEGRISPGSSTHLTQTHIDMSLKTQSSSGDASSDSSKKVAAWLERMPTDKDVIKVSPKKSSVQRPSQ